MFFKLVIFWAEMWFSENCVVLMVSTISLAENDDLQASDSVLQIGHLVGSNRVQQELYRKSSKM